MKSKENPQLFRTESPKKLHVTIKTSGNSITSALTLSIKLNWLSRYKAALFHQLHVATCLLTNLGNDMIKLINI